jgi:hypothetical protein
MILTWYVWPVFSIETILTERLCVSKIKLPSEDLLWNAEPPVIPRGDVCVYLGRVVIYAYPDIHIFDSTDCTSACGWKGCGEMAVHSCLMTASMIGMNQHIMEMFHRR